MKVQLLLQQVRMVKLRSGLVEECFALQLFKVANLSMELFGALKMTQFSTAVIKISLLFQLYLVINRSNGKLMMEWFLHVIGIQATILLSLVEKTANIVYGINMVVNFIAHHLMIMLLQASNGLLMEIISQLEVLKCSDCVINLDGLIHSTNLKLDQ